MSRILRTWLVAGIVAVAGVVHAIERPSWDAAERRLGGFSEASEERVPTGSASAGVGGRAAGAGGAIDAATTLVTVTRFERRSLRSLGGQIQIYDPSEESPSGSGGRRCDAT